MSTSTPATHLITGASSGLGLALAEAFLEQGHRVLATSRRPLPIIPPPNKESPNPAKTDREQKQHTKKAAAPPISPQERLLHIPLDLADHSAIAPAIRQLIADTPSLDTVWLNAGILSPLADIADTPTEEFRRALEINVLANKPLLDTLFQSGIPIGHVIAISSGAALNCNRGWGPYSLSKAALNAFTALYSRERPDTHFTALAPGLIDTAMQDYLCGDGPDPEKFPAIQKLRNARGTSAMPQPREAARLLIDALPRLRGLPSGSFADIRNL